MTELDTSAYTPAHEIEETEDEQEEDEEEVRTRFQVPLDQSQKPRLDKTLEKLEEILREGTEAQEKIHEIKSLVNQYDARKFLNVYVYECRKCGELFDTKQGAGVHRSMNPNCDRTEPWTRNYENLEQQFDIQRVEEYYEGNQETE